MHSKCYCLALEVLRSLAIGLDLDENIFNSNFINGECTLMRLLHYPPLPSKIEKNQIRAGEHTDYGDVTLLFQDSVGGLEVKTLDNEWISAPFVENTVLINERTFILSRTNVGNSHQYYLTETNFFFL